MKGRFVSSLLFCFCILLVIHSLLFIQLSRQRASLNREKTIHALPLAPSIYSVLAGEFQGLTANFLYLDVAATLGGRKDNNLTDADWDEVEKMFAIVIRLDPYFAPTFRAIQAYLPWLAKRPEHAIQLLMDVYAKRYWDWLPTFFIAFDNYFFLNDLEEASKFFFAAAKFKDAPPLLATLGGRLAADADEDDVGIEFLTRLLKTKETKSEKKLLQDRILALQGLKELKILIGQYFADYGSYPPNLYDLVFLGYTEKLPVNPYYETFFYQDRKVRFDPFPNKTHPPRQRN